MSTDVLSDLRCPLPTFLLHRSTICVSHASRQPPLVVSKNEGTFVCDNACLWISESYNGHRSWLYGPVRLHASAALVIEGDKKVS